MDEPYDEDTLVSLITELYRLLIKLGYISESDLAFPPQPDGHRFDEAHSAELAMNPTVISLMKRLPYPRSRELFPEIQLFPECYAIPYTADDRTRRDARDPQTMWSGLMEDITRPNHLRPEEFALTASLTALGYSVVIDTNKSEQELRLPYVLTSADTLRLLDPWDPWNGAASDTAPEPEPGVEYIRAYPDLSIPQPATAFLRNYVDRVQRLKEIPGRDYASDSETIFTYAIRDGLQRRMKTIIESYGWPDHFRQDDWRRDREQVRDQARDEWLDEVHMERQLAATHIQS